jgi:hypothetical protein
MANTYDKIAQVVVGSGGAASIDFTSIPNNYDDLCVYLSTRLSVADNSLNLTINGNTGSINNFRYLAGSGSAASSASRSNSNLYDSIISNRSSWTASTFDNQMIYIPNYTSSNNKSMSHDGVAENNATAAWMQMTAIRIADTNPITSIKIYYSGTNNDIVQYSSATLYGIKKS